MPELRWGILSTGRIARIFAEQLAESATGRLGAVASRDRDRAGAFAAHFEDVRAHDTYQALLEDGDVDVVYIATPHTEHAEWTLKAMEAGKDVLCEKPLGVNHAEAMAVAAAARRHGRFLMEGFMYRVHPQTERLRRLLDEQAVGTVRHIRASFGYRAPFDAASRLFRPDLAGGGILDVGCYPVSMVRMVAGLAAGTGTLEPEAVAGSARIEGGVDVDAAALLRFPGDVTAHVAAACRLGLENDLEIFGTEGRILVPSPWFCGSDRGPGPWEIRILRQRMEPATISGDEHRGIFTVEADRVAEELARGRRECAAMTPEDSVGNAGVLDAWRREGGLTFPFELPEAGTRTVSRRPLVKGRAAPIPQQRLPGLNMPLSRLVMGCDNQTEMPHAAVMFDHFFEQGGNTFDTAHIYGGGLMERLLGQWLSDRGVRDEIVVIGKGAHTPRNRPEFVGPELGESLERLRTGYVDIYMLHRDNPDVPVEHWIEVLNAELDAGRIRIFGASNWTLERVREANRYAAAHGLAGFAAISNNFSLARMNEPVWPGCVASSDPDYRAFLEDSQLALLPWSSQARGFFAPSGAGNRSRPGWGNHPSEAEMVRVWGSPDNHERRRRAALLAAERGVEPVHIALAYVLCQPFPTFPLIGPRTLAETESSIRALPVRLTPEELAWLDLRGGRR